MRTTVVLLCLLAYMVMTQAIRCYNCKNCVRFEESHSKTCTPDSTRCMKMDLASGEVDRECGTEEMCKEKEKDTNRFTKVSCCAEDKCNTGTKMTSGVLPLLGSLLVTVWLYK